MNQKKKYFFFCFLGWGAGREGEGMARVSECFTMDPNKKKMVLEGEWWAGGARV